MKIAWVLIGVILLAGCSQVSKTVRTQEQAVLKEEVAWSEMYEKWSKDVYAARDCRAGFLAGGLTPYQASISGQLGMALAQVGQYANKESEAYKECFTGGSYKALYLIAIGQGIEALVGELMRAGVLR